MKMLVGFKLRKDFFLPYNWLLDNKVISQIHRNNFHNNHCKNKQIENFWWNNSYNINDDMKLAGFFCELWGARN